MLGSLLSSDLSTSRPCWGQWCGKELGRKPGLGARSFSEALSRVLCSQSTLHFWGARTAPHSPLASDIAWGHISLGTHLSFLTVMLYPLQTGRCKLSPEEPGCCQESRCFCCGHLLPPSPAHPGMSSPLPFSLLQPAFETSSSLAPPGSVGSCSNDRVHRFLCPQPPP